MVPRLLFMNEETSRKEPPRDALAKHCEISLKVPEEHNSWHSLSSFFGGFLQYR